MHVTDENMPKEILQHVAPASHLHLLRAVCPAQSVLDRTACGDLVAEDEGALSIVLAQDLQDVTGIQHDDAMQELACQHEQQRHACLMRLACVSLQPCKGHFGPVVSRRSSCQVGPILVNPTLGICC